LIGLIIVSLVFNLFVGSYLLPGLPTREGNIVNDEEFNRLLPDTPNQLNGGFVFPMPEPDEPPLPPEGPPG